MYQPCSFRGVETSYWKQVVRLSFS